MGPVSHLYEEAEPTFTSEGPALSEGEASIATVSDHVVGMRADEPETTGVEIELKVSDPEVPADGSSCCFYWSAIGTSSDSITSSVFVGWTETSWEGGSSDQYVFVYDGYDGVWNFYGQYSILPGEVVSFSLTHDSGNYWNAWVYSGGSWDLLWNEYVGYSYADNGHQQGRVADDGTHFLIHDPYFSDTGIGLDYGWNTWDTSIDTHQHSDSEYQAQVGTQWTEWWAEKS